MGLPSRPHFPCLRDCIPKPCENRLGLHSDALRVKEICLDARELLGEASALETRFRGGTVREPSFARSLCAPLGGGIGAKSGGEEVRCDPLVGRVG